MHRDPPHGHVITIRDVTLRDGLQDEAPIDTDVKVAVYEALRSAGVREFEVTSFVRPDRVPALADAEAMVAATSSDGSEVVRWGLVLNERGVDRAIAAGLTNLQFVVSASETHNHRNAGASVDDSLRQLARIVEHASERGVIIEATVATAFGCPFEGPIAVDAVLSIVDHMATLGVVGVSLADTIGTAVPREIDRLVSAAVEVLGSLPVGAHLHDTRGLAIANAFAALEAGAVRLDAASGGLGGCPFAPGASGNVPIEDLVHALHESGWTTGIDLPLLIEASRFACAAVGRSIASHIGIAGPRFIGMN